jgi:hypothetical protein
MWCALTSRNRSTSSSAITIRSTCC